MEPSPLERGLPHVETDDPGVGPLARCGDGEKSRARSDVEVGAHGRVADDGRDVGNDVRAGTPLTIEHIGVDVSPAGRRRRLVEDRGCLTERGADHGSDGPAVVVGEVLEPHQPDRCDHLVEGRSHLVVVIVVGGTQSRPEGGKRLDLGPEALEVKEDLVDRHDSSF